LILSDIDRTLSHHDITFARYQVIATLYFAEDRALTLSRLGQLLLVHPTSVTSIVDKLEAVDLVRRKPHPTDRRTTYAQLTRKGCAVYRAVRPELDRENYGIGGLSGEELYQLTLIIRKFREFCGDPVADMATYQDLVGSI
jgi:DNA-binding MarR family transcriptional regulator